MKKTSVKKAIKHQDQTLVETSIQAAVPMIGNDMPVLLRLSEPGRGDLLKLGKGLLVLGRDPDVELFVDDLKISRKHAELQVKERQLQVRDLDSTNGTFIKGERIQKEVVSLGEKIQFGTDCLFKFTTKDETELRYENELLRHATTDALTGLLNRATFTARAAREASLCERKGLPYSLSIIDVDLFKKVNDTYGHPAGDAVLRKVGELLTQQLREEDLCGRFGGEEFVVFFTATSPNDANKLCERVRKAIENHKFMWGDKVIPVTISLGVASISKKYADWEKALHAADEQLYKAKNEGRNRVQGIQL